MKQIIAAGKRLLGMRLVRVAAAGGSGLVLQTAVFWTLSTATGLLRHSSAVLVGGECGVLLSFFLNNRYSFGEQRGSSGSLVLRLGRYHLVVAGSLVIQWVCVFAAENMTDNLVIIHAAYALGVVLGFISNYTGYRLWVWRDGNAELRPQDTGV